MGNIIRTMIVLARYFTYMASHVNKSIPWLFNREKYLKVVEFRLNFCPKRVLCEIYNPVRGFKIYSEIF